VGSHVFHWYGDATTKTICEKFHEDVDDLVKVCDAAAVSPEPERLPPQTCYEFLTEELLRQMACESALSAEIIKKSKLNKKVQLVLG
jgi:hypothetical protein